MDITKALADLKTLPGFAEHVGMVMVHNGVVRAWSRQTREKVTQINIIPNYERMEQICRELEEQPGIFKIMAEAKSGLLKPGDDVLFLIVAGDIREHVKATFSELLDRIKAEAVLKEEHFE